MNKVILKAIYFYLRGGIFKHTSEKLYQELSFAPPKMRILETLSILDDQRDLDL